MQSGVLWQLGLHLPRNYNIMKQLILLLMLSLFLSPAPLDAQIKSVYDVKVDALDGGKINLSDYKGKKMLIVNTASKCGYTPQYEALQTLSEKYKEKLVVIGFPCNNFMFQEPGDAEKIREFCSKNYGVSFPMAAKIDVKGKNMHPLYVWLTQKKYNNFSDNSVKWNFQKYLIDETGKLIEVFEPGVDPLSDRITSAIEK
jgi:glutathione peroxidase